MINPVKIKTFKADAVDRLDSLVNAWILSVGEIDVVTIACAISARLPYVYILTIAYREFL